MVLWDAAPLLLRFSSSLLWPRINKAWGWEEILLRRTMMGELRSFQGLLEAMLIAWAPLPWRLASIRAESVLVL